MSIFLEISKKIGSQEKAARALDVSTSAYSDWVNGKKKPSIKNVIKIENVFGIPRADIRPDIYCKHE